MMATVGIDDDGVLVLRCRPESDTERDLLLAYTANSDRVKVSPYGVGNNEGFTLEAVDFWVEPNGYRG